MSTEVTNQTEQRCPERVPAVAEAESAPASDREAALREVAREFDKLVEECDVVIKRHSEPEFPPNGSPSREVVEHNTTRRTCYQFSAKVVRGFLATPTAAPAAIGEGDEKIYVPEKRCCTICDARKRCHICDAITLMACADCAIKLGATVYVCERRKCRDAHEQKFCPVRDTRSDNAEFTRLHADAEDRYRAGMLHAMRLVEHERDTFALQPEILNHYDSVGLGGYEDACDHLVGVIKNAAAIPCTPVHADAPADDPQSRVAEARQWIARGKRVFRPDIVGDLCDEIDRLRATTPSTNSTAVWDEAIRIVKYNFPITDVDELDECIASLTAARDSMEG